MGNRTEYEMESNFLIGVPSGLTSCPLSPVSLGHSLFLCYVGALPPYRPRHQSPIHCCVHSLLHRALLRESCLASVRSKNIRGRRDFGNHPEEFHNFLDKGNKNLGEEIMLFTVTHQVTHRQDQNQGPTQTHGLSTWLSVICLLSTSRKI